MTTITTTKKTFQGKFWKATFNDKEISSILVVYGPDGCSFYFDDLKSLEEFLLEGEELHKAICNEIK